MKKEIYLLGLIWECRRRNKKSTKATDGLEVSSISSKRALKARRESVENSLLTNRKILERMVSLQEIGAIEENTFLGQKDRCFKLKLSSNKWKKNLFSVRVEYKEIVRTKVEIKEERNTETIRTGIRT